MNQVPCPRRRGAVAENSNDQHWYAIQVRLNSERVVCRHLQSLEIEHLFPTSLLHKNWKSCKHTEPPPIFPGYLFVHLAWTTGPKLYKVPHLIRVLGFGKEPTPLDEREKQTLFASSSLLVKSECLGALSRTENKSL